MDDIEASISVDGVLTLRGKNPTATYALRAWLRETTAIPNFSEKLVLDLSPALDLDASFKQMAECAKDLGKEIHEFRAWKAAKAGASK